MGSCDHLGAATFLPLPERRWKRPPNCPSNLSTEELIPALMRECFSQSARARGYSSVCNQGSIHKDKRFGLQRYMSSKGESLPMDSVTSIIWKRVMEPVSRARKSCFPWAEKSAQQQFSPRLHMREFQKNLDAWVPPQTFWFHWFKSGLGLRPACVDPCLDADVFRDQWCFLPAN